MPLRSARHRTAATFGSLDRGGLAFVSEREVKGHCWVRDLRSQRRTVWSCVPMGFRGRLREKMPRCMMKDRFRGEEVRAAAGEARKTASRGRFVGRARRSTAYDRAVGMKSIDRSTMGRLRGASPSPKRGIRMAAPDLPKSHNFGYIPILVESGHSIPSRRCLSGIQDDERQLCETTVTWCGVGSTGGWFSRT